MFFPLTPVVYCNVFLGSVVYTWVTLFYKNSRDYDALMYSIPHPFSHRTLTEVAILSRILTNLSFELEENDRLS